MKQLSKETLYPIVDFSGGMNTHISPFLLPLNSATYIENAEVSTGKLVPLKKDLILQSFDYDKFKWFDDSYISLNSTDYANIYARKLFVSNGDVYLDKDTKINFKIEPPQISCSSNEQLYALQVALVFKENDEYYRTNYRAFGNELQYYNTLPTVHKKDMNLVVNLNEFSSDDEKILLIDNQNARARYIDTNDTYLIVKISKVSFDAQHRPTYTDAKYFNSSSYKDTFKGTTEDIYINASASEVLDLGDTAYPINESNYTWKQKVKSIITELPGATYVATYYSPTFGLETVPSNQIYCSKSTNNTINIVTNIPTNYKVRLYKVTDDGLIDFTLVGEYDTSTINDNKDTTELAGNHILDTYDNYPIPDNITHSVIYKGIHIAISENELYYSKIGQPAYFPKTNKLIFDEILEGIGVIQSGVVVFSKHKSWIISGSSEQNFYVYPLSYEIGCINKDSICYYKNTLIWLGYDGVYSTTGSTVENLTKNYLNDLNFDNKIFASTWNERVFISGINGKTLVIDFRHKVHFYFIADTYEYLEVVKSNLQGITNDSIVELFSSNENRMLTYISPKFTKPSTMLRMKYIKDLEVLADKNSNLTIELTIDDIISFLENSSKIFDNKDNYDIIRYKITKKQYRYFQLKIKSKGVVYEWIIS